MTLEAEVQLRRHLHFKGKLSQHKDIVQWTSIRCLPRGNGYQSTTSKDASCEAWLYRHQELYFPPRRRETQIP